MRILVLGANGMLGHAMHRTLHDAGRDVVGMIRTSGVLGLPDCATAGLRYDGGLDAETGMESMAQIVERHRPAVVVNAAACRPSAPIEQQLLVNAAFPGLLSELARVHGFRLLHISTDAVFDGKHGLYRETDLPSPRGTYAVCKFLGERLGRHVLILRTSMIGLNPCRGESLLDWFLTQTGDVPGRRDAVFSGMPVATIARLLHERLIDAMTSSSGLDGIWHLAAGPIDKFTLLDLVRQRFGRTDIRLVPQGSDRVDRSLDGSALNARLGWVAPPWPDLIDELYSFTCRHGLSTGLGQPSTEKI